VAGNTYTLSAWIKGVNVTDFRFLLGTNQVVFVTSQIVNGEWIRVSATVTATTTGAYQQSPARSNNTNSESFYIYGAQLVEGTEPLDYLPTTDRLDIARIDYSTGEPALLLEPQRTNVCTYSEDMTQGKQATNISVLVNTDIAPNGTQTADKLTSTSTSQPRIGSINVLSAGVFSVFAKSVDAQFIQLINTADGEAYANFDIVNGVIGTFGTKTTATIQNYGNGWYRCIAYFNIATAPSPARLYITTNISAGYGGGGVGPLNASLLTWGWQIEVGSYATSYIPTTSASVTRNADIISKPDLGTYMSPQNNTIFFDFTTISGGQNTNIFRFNTSSGNTIQFWYFLITNSINIQLGGVFYNTGILSGKVAIQINPTDTKMFVNGVLSATAGTTGVVTTLTSSLDIYSNGATMNCKTMQVYNTSLSDAECIALTTL
jgi:hypothetical protein